MAGYTPLFGSLTTGTLCGRWPDIGLWPVILSMSDKAGDVDVTCNYIATVTGLELEEVEACMTRFCGADRKSRSGEESGARLVLLEPHRDWGWHIVNHGKYREKARKMAFDQSRIEDGRNAERMRTRRDPRGPAKTRLDPPSNADANADTNTRKNKSGAFAPSARVRGNGKSPEFDPASVPNLDQPSWARWVKYRHDIGKPIKPPSLESAARALAKHGASQAAVVEQSVANGWQGLFELKASGQVGVKRKPMTLEEATALEDSRVAQRSA